MSASRPCRGRSLCSNGNSAHRCWSGPAEVFSPRRLVPLIDPTDLASETWIRAHDGSAADLAEHVLARHRLDPPRRLAGHGDEPVEIQALVVAGRGAPL